MTQTTLQSTAQSLHVDSDTDFVTTRSVDSPEIHKIGKRWYVGLLEDLPPPKRVQQSWGKTYLNIVVKRLGDITHPSYLHVPSDKAITEPVLCMAGKPDDMDTALEYLPRLSNSPRLVKLKPTVWIYCSGRRCGKKVKKEIPLVLQPFLDSFPERVEFHTSRYGPRPASNPWSPHSSDRIRSGHEISFAIGYPLLPDSVWPAVARFTVGSKNIYSTIGGPIYVGREVFGLTTAHGLVSYLQKISEQMDTLEEESLASDSDSETSSVLSCAGSYQDEGGDNLLESECEEAGLPKTLAYLGHGTSTGDYSLKEPAPITSDFALINLQSCHHPIHPITEGITPKDKLYPGEVHIASASTRLPLIGYLLESISFIIISGEVMHTRKIQISSAARK